MRTCATDSSKFYNVANGEELQIAYHDIAVQIGKVRLTY
jgi:hypothetical protein